MYERVILFLCAIKYCIGQNINSPQLDWIQTDGTGAYRFGYATGDEGRHYRVESASADNQVAGKFGYKDPKTGNDLQTTYTAGRRGFRARGPHIARRMDLSQNKPPFSRPNDDGQYHPELDNFFDPNEDRGYDFSYKTSDHIKEEHANKVGDVQGRYAYLDDLGYRHNVQYIAGSKTGFVVTNAVPDTFAQARGGPLYYVGKTGGSKIRGYSAVQKNLNGAYRFLASGPDHKRSEVSDASGNRRGVYTYLDDKGIQHTVEYIAGPKTGYKVINNRRGFNYNPILPYFPDTSTILPLLPSSPQVISSTPFPTLPISISSTNAAASSGTNNESAFSPSSFGSSSGNAFGGGGNFDTNDFNAGIGGFESAGNKETGNFGIGKGNTLGGDKGTGFGGSSDSAGYFSSTSGGSGSESSLGASADNFGGGGSGSSEIGGFGSDGGNDFGSSGRGEGNFVTGGSGTIGSAAFASLPPGNRPQGGIFSSSHPTISTDKSHPTSPSLFTPSSGKPPHSLFQPSSGKPSSVNIPNKIPPHSFQKPSNFPSTTHRYPEKPHGPGDFEHSTQKWSYDYDHFEKDSISDWSKPTKDYGAPTSTPKVSFDPFLNFPESPESPFPDVFGEGLNTAESSAGFKSRPETQSKHDCKNEKNNDFEHNAPNKIGETDSTDQKSVSDYGKNIHQGSIKHYYKDNKTFHYPSRGTVKFGGVRKNEWRKIKNEDGYFSIPPGVAIRAHVQSLDIVPYNKRHLPPGEALESQQSNKKEHDSS